MTAIVNLPIYVFCGRHLLAAKLRTVDKDAADGAKEEIARIVAQIRARWPEIEILTYTRLRTQPADRHVVTTA